jgi:hypothetical protein
MPVDLLPQRPVPLPLPPLIISLLLLILSPSTSSTDFRLGLDTQQLVVHPLLSFRGRLSPQIRSRRFSRLSHFRRLSERPRLELRHIHTYNLHQSCIQSERDEYVLANKLTSSGGTIIHSSLTIFPFPSFSFLAFSSSLSCLSLNNRTPSDS